MQVLIVGGSDAGMPAALRARELQPAVTVTVVLADAYPDYSICGLPFYLSGEVEDWRRLAHRTGYIGLEMADALTLRGIEVSLIGRSPSPLPTVDPELVPSSRRSCNVTVCVCGAPPR